MKRICSYIPVIRHACLFFIVGSILSSIQLQAQVFKANTDNLFATPGAYALLNLLSNDELGECSESEIMLAVVTDPVHGNYQLNQLSKVMRYIPASGWFGTDSLEYSITCNGTTSTAWVYIHTNNQPDNMYPDACAVTPPATTWEIELVNATDVFVHDYAQPFVGDIDNDGELEILAFNRVDTYISDGIYIFRPDLTLKHSFPIPQTQTHGIYPLVIADIDKDGFGEIIIASFENGFFLHCFRHDGTLMWTSEYPYFQEVPPMTTDFRNSPSIIIGDINNDGYPEIVAGDRIFDALTGVLLADLPADMPRGGMNSNTHYIYMPAMADFDNDGQLEIACGSVVYKAHITDRTPSAYISGKNTVEVLANVSTTIGETRKDGWVSVADIDGDGFLDVVVVNGSPMNWSSASNSTCPMMYAWSPQKKTVLGKVELTGETRGSRAFIGDITGDGTPDVAFTYALGMVAYKYDIPTASFIQLFKEATTDNSGATTMSMFDFDLDGEVELVYRDETHLRILDKNGNDRVKINCFAPTHTEYPVVVDIDNDGHADIIVSGAFDSVNREETRLMHFRHPDNTWAKCRTVYNQFAYNPVYINEDLTVPQYPINPATEFISKDGSTRTKPYNHFLQQVTDLNGEGNTLYQGPDLYFDKNYKSRIIWDTANDKLVITIGINNNGDNTYNDNLRITTYLIDNSLSPAQEYLIGDVTQAVTLPLSTQVQITYEVTGIAARIATVPHYTNWEIRLNQNPFDRSFPAHSEECLYYNNINSTISLAQGEHVMCESDPADENTCEWVKLFPQDTYDFYWFDIPGPVNTSQAIHMGDSMKICKDNTLVEKYYIQVWEKGSAQMITAKIDTVHVYLFPDSLVWTGMAEDQNWHNFENWYNPNSSIYPRGNIPRQCTHVLIPDVVTNYPDLSPLKTDYSYYRESECNRITFEHGGELSQPDSLVYTSAFVQLNLFSNQWHMLSPPLQDMYPGDYYVHNPDPCEDDVFVYTRLFSTSNPETGHYIAADWTGLFHNPNVEMPCGFGFSAWIDDKQPDESIHDSIHFTFPKNDLSYVVYGQHCRYAYEVPVTREKKNRFIFEKNRNNTSGEILLSCSAQQPGELSILGNPFMATWDFEKLYHYNQTAIKPYYQVLDAEAENFVSFYLQGGLSTGNLTQYIPPMQSVIIESNTPFPALYTTADMTTTQPGAKLRSAGNYTPANNLPVKIEANGQSNKSILVYEEGTEEANVSKIFMENMTQPVSVFLLDEQENFLDILHTDQLDGVSIPLGIRTSQTGSLRLEFEETNRFARDYEIFLVDTYGEKPIQRNIRIFPYYEFNKTTSGLFLTDRFFLSFDRKTTSIHSPVEPTINTAVEIFSHHGNIRIISVDQTPLKEINIYDMQGRIIHTAKHIHQYQTHIPLPTGNIYLVKVQTENAVKTVKLYHK